MVYVSEEVMDRLKGRNPTRSLEMTEDERARARRRRGQTPEGRMEMNDQLTLRQRAHVLRMIVAYTPPIEPGLHAKALRDADTLEIEAARREAEAKVVKRCDRLDPPVCLHPDACRVECAFNKPANACAADAPPPPSRTNWEKENDRPTDAGAVARTD